MKRVVIGAHLLREDVEPAAEAIPAGELWLSGVSVADDQPLGDRDLLLRVADLRAKLLDTATFVAIRYGFTVSSAAEAASKCAPHLDRWKRLLTEHRDDVEMTLKTAAAAPQSRPNRRDFTSGADYLRALHAAAQASQPDARLRAEVERQIVPVAKKHCWIARDEKSVELAALIPRAELWRVREAGEALRCACPAVPFLLSGPWPLEVFADADRE